ncbi:unnamed protein product [Peniophora sp. CBMAI 1063]|nr:unnamed protein product [Peniophora sp. CBMAI 1063]
MLEDLSVYKSLKSNNAPQSDISKAADKTSRKIIQQYGWEDPLRTTTTAEATREGPLDEQEQKRRDTLFRKVHGEVLKVWRETLASEAAVAGKPSAEIVDLIKIFARKPRRKQLYKVWAKSKERPELEREVDAHHAAAIQAGSGTSPTPRVAIWNVVAAEQYKNASKKEKKAARKQGKRIHRQDMKKWEASAATNPESPDEAIEFMKSSQLFLSDLMHFFANRASGVAIMFLSGPGGSSLVSEGVCNVLGQPKLLYSEANPGGCEDFKYAVTKQAQIMNEIKWGKAATMLDQNRNEDDRSVGNIGCISDTVQSDDYKGDHAASKDVLGSSGGEEGSGSGEEEGGGSEEEGSSSDESLDSMIDDSAGETASVEFLFRPLAGVSDIEMSRVQHPVDLSRPLHLYPNDAASDTSGILPVRTAAGADNHHSRGESNHNHIPEAT